MHMYFVFQLWPGISARAQRKMYEQLADMDQSWIDLPVEELCSNKDSVGIKVGDRYRIVRSWSQTVQSLNVKLSALLCHDIKQWKKKVPTLYIVLFTLRCKML